VHKESPVNCNGATALTGGSKESPRRLRRSGGFLGPGKAQRGLPGPRQRIGGRAGYRHAARAINAVRAALGVTGSYYPSARLIARNACDYARLSCMVHDLDQALEGIRKPPTEAVPCLAIPPRGLPAPLVSGIQRWQDGAGGADGRRDC
jgi:hypothetical protein